MAKLGATDREIAEELGIAERTLHRWKHTHKDLCQSLKLGKDEADARVEQSLYRRATGYTYDSEKLFAPAGTRKVLRAAIIEHVPPDVTACIFWLKNRKRAEWRDKPDNGVTDSPEDVARKIRDAVAGMDALTRAK